MKSEIELYQRTVALIEQAAQHIQAGQPKQAKRILFNLDADVYESALDMYEQRAHTVDYFRARYVFASLEPDPEQRPSDIKIEYYASEWKRLSEQRAPKVVSFHSRPMIINQLSLVFASA